MSNPFPNKFVTKLKFHQEITLNPGVGTLGTHTFRANSVYDPDFTGVGAQPRYFDEIMPLYDHFVVLGSKITATMFNNQNDAAFFAINRNDNGIPGNKVNDLIEQRNTRYTWLTDQTSAKAMRTLTMTFSPKKFLSRSKPLSDPDLKGTVSSNPNEGAYFSVCYGGFPNSIDPATNIVHVVIDYIVAFIEPKRVGAS